jgi:succinyl-CoA synthetase beta subunit
MNLHEYQAKQLLAEYNIPVAKGQVVKSVAEAEKVADQFADGKVVVKAQVHAGGRGKAGGVKLVNNKKEVVEVVKSLLGKNLVTYQTTAAGQPVNEILLEEPCAIDRELYLGAVVDRAQKRIVFMASTEGGMEIEKVAEHTPEKILTITVDPLVGAMPYQGRQLAYALKLQGDQVKAFSKILVELSKLFKEHDLSLLEINPLVVTKD